MWMPQGAAKCKSSDTRLYLVCLRGRARARVPGCPDHGAERETGGAGRRGGLVFWGVWVEGRTVTFTVNEVGAPGGVEAEDRGETGLVSYRIILAAVLTGDCGG